MPKLPSGGDQTVPAKIIEYKGQEIRLFTSRAVCILLERNWRTFKKFEKAGYLPSAFFVYGRNRYYCEAELEVLRQAKRKFGRPKPNTKQIQKWSEYVAIEWAKVRHQIATGQPVDFPQTYNFSGAADFKEFMALFLKQLGIVNHQFIEIAVEEWRKKYLERDSY